jgi:hypothetical protein
MPLPSERQQYPVELSPCPFCGGKAEFEQIGNRRRSTIVTCTNCGCTLETGEEWGQGSQWNTRIDTTKDVTQMSTPSDTKKETPISDALEQGRQAWKDGGVKDNPHEDVWCQEFYAWEIGWALEREAETPRWAPPTKPTRLYPTGQAGATVLVDFIQDQ